MVRRTNSRQQAAVWLLLLLASCSCQQVPDSPAPPEQPQPETPPPPQPPVVLTPPKEGMREPAVLPSPSPAAAVPTGASPAPGAANSSSPAPSATVPAGSTPQPQPTSTGAAAATVAPASNSSSSSSSSNNTSAGGIDGATTPVKTPAVVPVAPVAVAVVPVAPAAAPVVVPQAEVAPVVPPLASDNVTTGNSSTRNATVVADVPAVSGIAPHDTSDRLLSALLGALGAQASPADALTRARRSSSSTRRRRSSNSSSSGTRKRRKGTLTGDALQQSTGSFRFADLRSSRRLTEGLLATPDGASTCVLAGEGVFIEPGSNVNSRASFASAELFDPACDDDAIDHSVHCQPGGGSSQQRSQQQQQSLPHTLSFMDVATTVGMSNASKLACTKAFTKAGRAPRSLAVILLKWSRKYYKSQAECCAEQGNAPGCDCLWGGRTFDNLPPPSAYSRMFTDECDGKPSINRAYYDNSGGSVSFHSRLRVPTPATLASEVAVRNGSAAAAAAAAAASATTAAAGPLPASAAGLLQSTDKSFLDPDGVDVFGWATLDVMRESDGTCRDWCGEAITQLGVDAGGYNHVMCMALQPSKAICDTCNAAAPGASCIGTCPAATGITTGCGCATCYYAWGGQSSCNRPAPAGVKTGLAALVSTYPDTEEPLLPGGQPRLIAAVNRGNRVYMAHELGHNLGLTHTGALNCRVTNGVINREPAACTPDWYGDTSSYMGSGPDLQLPAALKYKVRWLPRGTLKEHVPGTEVRYTLKAATSRRPSLQESSSLRWFNAATDTLTVRVPLRTPSPEVASVGGYKCPCAACPACSTREACTASEVACCMDAKCADDQLTFYYIELHQPYRNDNNPAAKGLAIRMMGSLGNCTSTRAVPTHVAADGKPAWLLDTPDPTGAALGSSFTDGLRNVQVVLEEWTRAQAVIRVRA